MLRLRTTSSRVGIACWLALLFVAGVSRLTAQEAAATSPAEAVQVYRDAASFQNNGAFDLAVEEWQKFLKNYPKDPLAAKAQHYLGVCQLQLKQFDAAAASFAAVIKSYPKFELLEDTYLNLASSQYSLATGGQPEKMADAAATFAKLLEAYPKGKYVEDATWYLGEAQYAQGKKEEAAKTYARLLTDFPQSKRRPDALYALGVTQEELGQHAEAGQTYDAWLKDFADLPLATEVRMRKAETLLQTGDAAKAAAMFAEVATTKDFAAADHALARQAFSLAKLDRFSEAGDVYAHLATEFANSSQAPEATIAAGRAYYRAGQADKAAQWLRQALARNDANSAEAAHWLCRLLIKEKKPAEAAALASEQLATKPEGDFAAHLQVDLADALYEQPEKRAEALASYVAFTNDHPQHELAAQALYNAAFTALELKQYDAGLAHAQAFLQRFPEDKLVPDVKYVAAESHLQLKQYAEAEKLYGELISQHAMHAEADAWKVRLGLVAFLQKEYADVIATLLPVVQSLKSPAAKAEAQYLIGASQFYSDKFDEATASLTASLAADANWKQADETLLLLARAQARLGQSNEAKASIDHLLKEHPTSGVADQAHYRLGELLYAADDFAGALAAYGEVTQKYPDSPFAPYAHYGTGWSQLKSKDFAAAATSLTALLVKYPNHALAADALFGRALARRQAGDAKGAIADVDAYLQTKPDRAHESDALYERGLAQVAAGDFAGAVSTLEGLLKADPKYAATDKVLYELGWALKSQNKHAEAVPYFARIASEHSQSPLAAEASFHVGEDHYEKKQYAEAAEAYEAAKAKSPQGELGEKASYKLGWAQFQQKDYAVALSSFSEQLAAFPQGALAADAVFMKAECLFRQEKYDAAWPAYQAALQTKASTPTIAVLTLLHAGQSAAQLKQWDESVKLYTAIEQNHADSPLLAEALYERGWARQNLGESAEAKADYEKAASESRDHVGARARFMLGELLFSEKKHDEAIREFQRAMFGYGGEQAAAETKNWQAKSGYEAGRCAEVQASAASDSAAKAKHLANARRLYGFVVQKHPQHELAAEAQKRLAALGG